MTKKEMYVKVIALVNDSELADKAEIVEKLNHEIDLLNNRSSSSKPTAVQKANVAIMDTIKAVLGEQDNPVTITELLADTRLQTYKVKKNDGVTMETMTNQKLTSLMKKLVDSGAVKKEMVKKKAYFSIA